MSADRGAASVYVLASAVVVLLAGMAGSAVGSAVVARHRAGAAADFGALAAASSAQRGSGSACAVAERVVRANEARLVSCRLSGADAIVTAAVAPRMLGDAWGEAQVTARAGPMDRPPGPGSEAGEPRPISR